MARVGQRYILIYQVSFMLCTWQLYISASPRANQAPWWGTEIGQQRASTGLGDIWLLKPLAIRADLTMKVVCGDLIRIMISIMSVLCETVYCWQTYCSVTQSWLSCLGVWYILVWYPIMSVISGTVCFWQTHLSGTLALVYSVVKSAGDRHIGLVLCHECPMWYNLLLADILVWHSVMRVL